MSHQVGVDPVDDACIDISDLEQGRHPGISGTAIDPDHVSHPPVAAVFNNHDPDGDPIPGPKGRREFLSDLKHGEVRT